MKTEDAEVSPPPSMEFEIQYTSDEVFERLVDGSKLAREELNRSSRVEFC